MDRLDPKWKTPCILEGLLSNPRKSKLLTKTLTALGFKIKAYSNYEWFDIVEKSNA